MTPQQNDAMKLALEALKKCHYYMINAGLPNQSLLNEGFTAYKALEEVLAEHAMREVQRLGQEIEQEPVIGKWSLREVYFDEDGEPISHRRPPQRTEQEPVADALYFARWTTDKKDLSDYILVGSLTLAGIEDGEYGTSEIDPLDNTIDALQERLVTGSDHKKVPLLAYIGELKPTPPQRTEQEPVACCGKYETCTQACTPRGRFLGKREALAQPEQEPHGWYIDGYGAVIGTAEPKSVRVGEWLPWYTTPPQRTWVGLTDDELLEIYGWRKAPMLSDFIVEEAKQELLGALRKVEAKLKEKNT